MPSPSGKALAHRDTAIYPLINDIPKEVYVITKKKSRKELQLLSHEALEAYRNRPDFRYDANGDALYRRYKDQYAQLGKTAMQDTMGQAAALTGGYGSSYAQNVGQQAYQSYLSKVDDVIPELYQLAYDRYRDKGDRLYKAYQSWSQLERQAAQQEQWEREYELEERKRQDANRRFELEQERENSQTQTDAYQPDHWAMLARYRKLGLQTQSQETASKKAQTANTPVTMTKTQQTEQFVANTDSWETVARSGNGYESYEEYLKTRIDSALSKGQLTSGEAAWLISYYSSQIGESTDDQYTSDRFKQLQKQVMAQLAADVDVSYIESFLTDAREFVLQTEEDIKNLTWTTATSDQAMDKRNASVQAIKDRANKVRAWLDANKSRITQDSYQQYIQYLDDFADFLDQSADYFKRTTAEFSRFDTQEQYDQTVQEYEQNQAYYDKYSGMTANHLTALAASLPEGKEKNWVLSYAAQTPKTKEELQQELVWAQGQYEYLCRLQNEGAELAALKSQLEAATPGAPGYAELKKRYENMLRQYPTMSIFEDLDGQIAAVEKTIWELRRDEKYNYVNENEDFDTYSRYVSTKSDGWWDKLSSKYGMGYDDLKYEYINGAANGMRSEITEKSSTWDGTITHQFGIYDHMKPDEISIYNYYYAKHGKEQAEEYLDSIASTLEARSDSLAIQRAMEIASEHKVLSSALSIWGNLASGVEYIEDVVDYGIEKIKGNPYASLGSNQAALMSNTIRSTVAEQVDWEIGNWDAFDFLYNTAMSGADSIVSSTLFGKFGGIALGLSAAAQGTNDALSRGMSDGQAFWSGLFSGVFEGLFETVSLGQFSSLKEVAPESLKDIFKNLGKSMLVNASEETLTEIANIGYDTLVNGEFAHYTLEELKSGAWKNALWQVLESGASGLLIGAGMSMVGSTSSYGNQQVQNYQTGKNIQKTDGGVDALLNSADQVRSVSSAQMQSTLTSQIDKVNQKPTARSVGQLYATVQAANNQTNAVVNQEDVAKSLRSKGVYSKEVDGIAEAIVARLNGQELIRRQRSTLSFALNSSAVRDTISEFINRRKNSTEQPSQNIRENMRPAQTSSDPEKLQKNQFLNQKYHKFSEAAVLPEQHEGVERAYALQGDDVGEKVEPMDWYTIPIAGGKTGTKYRRIKSPSIVGVDRTDAVNQLINENTRKANPAYSSKNPAYRQNCQRCVAAYEMRRRGYDVIAAPAEVNENGLLSRRDPLYFKWDKVFSGAKFIRCQGKDGGLADIIKKMGLWGDGAVAEVKVQWNATEAHVFIAERVNGVVRFVDPQNGDVDCSSYFTRAVNGATMISRIDNLEPTTVIEQCIKNRGGK